MVALLAAVVGLGLLAAPAARAGEGSLDTPTMPPECFGPAQTSGDPYPCPLVDYDARRPTLLLWGDSHAWQYIPALRRAVAGRDVNLVSFVAGSCPPVAIPKRPGKDYSAKCEQSNYEAMQTVRTLIKRKMPFRIVLGSNWSGFRIAYRRLFLEDVVPVFGYTDYTKKMVRLAHEGTPRLFTQLGKLGVDVTVIGQAATVPDLVMPCPAGQDPYQCRIPRWQAIPEEQDTATWLKGQMGKLRGDTRYVDATPAYCDATFCAGNVGGISTWYDHLHLSATRTRNLSSYFAGTVRQVKRDAKRRPMAARWR